jgi:putative transposase
VGSTEAAGSPVRVGKTQLGEGNRKTLRAPKAINGERVVRRVFPPEYKLSILAEYDRCSESGEKGALLRREGLYSSIVTDWRRQHREGTLVVSEGRASTGGRQVPSRDRQAPCRERTPQAQAREDGSDHRGPGKSAGALGRALQERGHRRHVELIQDAAIDELVARGISRVRACRALGRSRASHYRRHCTPPIAGPPAPRPRSHRALSDELVDEIVAVLNSERFCDQAPAQVWATLLDEGRYLASVSTMYRILRAQHQVRERRRQARHPAHVKPELVADGPNQVWSWDVTRLAGPHKWTWFQLYVILDVYSRYAVGWLVAPRESDRLAQELIAACAAAEQIPTGQLTLHADRGSSMTSRTVAQLLTDLGVTRSHSRPHVSNDNPFSEAQFKTLKSTPRFPERFVSLAHARTFVDTFFAHYNDHHRHSGIGYHTPASVHHGHHHAIREHRQAVLDHAYATHPHRFRQPPQAPRVPHHTWINQPQPDLSQTA